MQSPWWHVVVMLAEVALVYAVGSWWAAR